MPIVFVIARDWPLRAMVRAELRERGIEAIGMQTAADAGIRAASGTVPSVVVMEASETVEPGLEALARRVPFIVVASAVKSDMWPTAARVIHRPARVEEVVTAVLDILRGQAA